MKVSIFSDIGRYRDKNEDYVLVSKNKVGKLDNLFVLCDGVGGNKAGEVASKLACKSFFKNVKHSKINVSSESDIKSLLQESLSYASYSIKTRANKSEKRNGMATTVVACSIINNKLFATSVGDSRIYMITIMPEKENANTVVERKSIVQVTQDDAQIIEEIIRPKEIYQESAVAVPVSRNRKVLTKAVGLANSIQGNYYEIDFNKKIEEGCKVVFVLCSDGLYDGLYDKEILNVISDIKFKHKAKDLVKESIRKGSRDNVSTVVIEL